MTTLVVFCSPKKIHLACLISNWKDYEQLGRSNYEASRHLTVSVTLQLKGNKNKRNNVLEEDTIMIVIKESKVR